MDLFSDILPPLPSSVPIGTVVQQVARSITPTHHPDTSKPSRAPQTSRFGLPAVRVNPWQRVGQTLSPAASTDLDLAIRECRLSAASITTSITTARSSCPRRFSRPPGR